MMTSAKVYRGLLFGVALAALLDCGSSQSTQPSSGVPNMQPANEPAPERCRARGDVCSVSRECCTEWCVNGHCALKSP